MPRFAITEAAGRIVAGHTNTGVGSVLSITDTQASDALKSGQLVALDTKEARKTNRKKTADDVVVTGPVQAKSDQSASAQ